jgi:hypothetical protein
MADHLDGVIHQRKVFREVALAWVRAYPESSDALFALALSEEMLLDATALDRLQRARRLLRPGDSELQIAAAEVWLRCKLAIPDNIAELEAARALAYSLVAESDPANPYEARILAELSALIGRPSLSAAFARRAVDESLEAPLARATSTLTAFAAMGHPVDSIAYWENGVESAIRQFVADSLRLKETIARTAQAAILAFGVHEFRLLESASLRQWPLLAAQASFAHGDADAALATLEGITAGREGFPVEDISIDMVFAEASLLHALGQNHKSSALLDGILLRLPRVQPDNLSRMGRSGPLVRAMALRAELAAEEGDTISAQRWASAVTVLWENGERSVQPLLRSMTQLARP